MSGLAGDDILLGRYGPDTMRGHSGWDVLRGQGTYDDLRGGLGDDRLFGGRDDDALGGGLGDDVIRGGPDYDEHLFGGPGDDRLYGGPGGDFLQEGAGQDSLRGKTGDDKFRVKRGADHVYAGKGDDRIKLIDDQTVDTIRCGPGADSVVYLDPKDSLDRLQACETITSKPQGPLKPKDTPAGDITKVELIHRSQTMVLRVTTADVSNLLPCSMGANDSFDIFIDTDGDPNHEREIFVPWQCNYADVYDFIDTDGHRYCHLPEPSFDTNTDRFTLPVPKRCLPDAAERLRASAELWSNRGRIWVDRTDWTPFAAVGERASVQDPTGDKR